MTARGRGTCVIVLLGLCLGLQVIELETLAVSSRNTLLKQALLREMTPHERHHFFGDVPDPVFYLVRPRLSPDGDHNTTDGYMRFLISSPVLSVDSVVAPVRGLVAPHLSTGVYVDGELVEVVPDRCHFRAANASHVITVNNCDTEGLDGIIITPEQLATLHPLPRRLLPVVDQYLPPPPPDTRQPGHSASPNHTLQHHSNPTEGEYGLHILQISRKDEVPVHRRRRREDEDEADVAVCATGPEHDMRRRVRNVSELAPGIDLQHGAERYQGEGSAGLENEPELHNHTVEAQPVSIVVRKSLELAVFADNVFYQNFPERVDSSDKSKMVNYILTLVNAIQGIYHQEELQGFVIDIRVVRLDIHTAGDGPNNGGGDIGAYLTSFCAWQQQRNPASEGDPEHWDHAIMLSGLDLTSAGNPSVIGLAWVGGMCRPDISCTMNEGRSFIAVYVVAHEMGHNLGMNHDGQGDAQQCSSSKYIMSPSVGPGKTTWSTCSVNVVHSFLSKSSCLDDGGGARDGGGRAGGPRENTIELEAILKRTPGYEFPLPEQCNALFGRDYYPALTKFDLCEYLYCTNGVVTRPAHPALEGSFCGSHRVCISGECRPEADLVKLHRYSHPDTSELTPSGLPPSTSGSPPSTSESPPSTSESPPSTSESPPSTSESPPSTSESPPPTTIIPTSTEEPGTFEAGVPTGPPPPPPTVTPYDCSCNLTVNDPSIVRKIPQAICPFLAPAYQALFNCSAQCSEYDLYLDLVSGNLTKVPIRMSELEKATKSCVFGSYSLTSDKVMSITDQMIDKLISPIKDLRACLAIPQFLEVPLYCPPFDSDAQCAPHKIVVKELLSNLTYVQVKDGDYVDKTVELKGKSYSLMRSAEHEQGESLIVPFTSSTNTSSMSSFLKCDLKIKFPKELENLPELVCPFLAPSLHDLFNCGSENQCPEYVLFIDLIDSTVTKVPLKKPSQPPPCLFCKPEEQFFNFLLFDTLSFLNSTLEDSASLCRLIPSAWHSSLEACRPGAESDTISDDTCLPVTIVIHSNNIAFTYTAQTKEKDYTGEPTIKWLEKPYALDKITKNKDIREILEEEYTLDFDANLSKRSLSHELSVIPEETRSSSPAYLRTREWVSNYREPSSRDTTSPDTAQGGEGDSVLDEALQEYVGQNDVFLPLNAPEAMPRTKVGACSVTCGQGVRLIQMECVDVISDELVSEDACQGYTLPQERLEHCHMPACRSPRWSTSAWGPCSEACGAGVQFRRVDCAIEIVEEDAGESLAVSSGGRSLAHLVVARSDCPEKDAPRRVRECHGACLPVAACEGEDCEADQHFHISRDFDY